jgi:hypothetical protein
MLPLKNRKISTDPRKASRYSDGTLPSVPVCMQMVRYLVYARLLWPPAERLESA